MILAGKKLEFPLIQGGMGVGVSLGNLAGHVAACGGMGVISSVNCGYREADFERNTLKANLRALRREIEKARKIAGGRGLIGVNIMTAVSHYEETVRCAAEAGADAIISGAGLPLNLPELLKGSKALAAPIVSSGRAAKLLIRRYESKFKRRPDFFVCEGYKAGGHLGFSPEDLANGSCRENSDLLLEILEAADNIPVFAAGGVYSGQDMARMVKLGAAGAQIGTRFIATHECDADPEFKRVILEAEQEDIMITVSPVGMPARAIKSPLLKRLKAGETFKALRCNNCLTACKHQDAPYCISRALIAAVRGDYENGLFFSGSNGARIDRIVSVAELMAEIKSEYQQEMARQA